MRYLFVKANFPVSNPKQVSVRGGKGYGAESRSDALDAGKNQGTVLVSWRVGDATATRSFEIALVANAIWLGLYALFHLIRSPWLLHHDQGVRDSARDRHWGWGIFGASVVLLMIAGAVAGGLWLHATSQLLLRTPLRFTTPTEKDAEITQLKQQVRDRENAPGKIVTRTQEPEKRCWLSNHFGFPNSKIQGAVTATAAIFRCNYRIEVPFVVAVEFDRDFIPGALVLPDSGMIMSTGPAQKKEGKVFIGQVAQPALLVGQLAIVTVFGMTDQFPRAVSAKFVTQQ